MSEISVLVHPDADVLAQAAAARLVIRLLDAQAARGNACVVLTGGGIAARTYAALRASPARDAVDWSRVDFWWGDERFLPAGHPDRNETQARSQLLDALGYASLVLAGDHLGCARPVGVLPSSPHEPTLTYAAVSYLPVGFGPWGGRSGCGSTGGRACGGIVQCGGTSRGAACPV
jgi:hypothetical protein